MNKLDGNPSLIYIKMNKEACATQEAFKVITLEFIEHTLYTHDKGISMFHQCSCMSMLLQHVWCRPQQTLNIANSLYLYLSCANVTANILYKHRLFVNYFVRTLRNAYGFRGISFGKTLLTFAIIATFHQ